MQELNTQVEVLDIDDKNHYGKFSIGPLDRGYGITLGNSLRRVLLSSLPGDAVASIKIDGVLHEFSVIEGVVEDVPEIILNIKGVALKKSTKEEITLTIDIDEVKGSKKIFAKDLEVDEAITVANKDHLIATLNEDAKLHMELKVKSGKGYTLSEFNKNEDDPVGTIAIDSSFTPVERVNFTVENTRVGQITDFDKLILEVWTNGTITPKDAIGKAADILMNNLALFKCLPDEVKEEEVIETHNVVKEKDILDKTIEELDFSLRSFNCLKKQEISTLRDLVAMTVSELENIKGFGKKSFQEVEEKVHSMGLSFRDEE